MLWAQGPVECHYTPPPQHTLLSNSKEEWGVMAYFKTALAPVVVGTH